jgi:acyl-CoA synthetase (NDP forming)
MRSLLEPLSLPFVESTEVASVVEATDAMSAIAEAGGRAVMKALSDHALHKSELGLVELGVETPEEAAAVYMRLADRARTLKLMDAVIVVQQMAPDGVDLFLGSDRDPAFGPMLFVGMGGTTVELFRDVTRRLPPLGPRDVAAMLASLRSAPLLEGFRGSAPVDTKAFCELVVTVGDLVTAVPELAELDLNPIRILPDGRCLLLDAVGALRPVEEVATPIRRLQLAPLVEPRSIAVVGASRTESRPGARIVRSLVDHGFPGPIYPVNQAGGVIGGLQAYTSLQDVPVVPDLACVALPASASVESVRECVRLGVPAVIVFASGFSEVGTEGEALDEQIRAAVAGSSTVLCGPNTIGIVNAHVPMAATFSQALSGFGLIPAGTSLIAQSGAVAGSLVSREMAEGYGIGDWVTVGNQSTLDVADFLAYYAGRKSTTSLAVFLEGVPDGQRFRAALRTAREAGKPVVVFKTGTTDAGRRAVASHSGALAGSDVVYRTVLEQERATSVDRMSSLLAVAWTLGNTPIPRGRRVAVVTTSGGAGSAVVDLLANHGLEIAEFSAETTEAAASVLPTFAHVENPLDVTADGAFSPGALGSIVEAAANDSGVDLVCVVLTSITGSDAVRVAREIAEAAARTSIPILVSWLVARQSAEKGMTLLAHNGLRVFSEPADMARAAAHLAERSGVEAQMEENP